MIHKSLLYVVRQRRIYPLQEHTTLVAPATSHETSGVTDHLYPDKERQSALSDLLERLLSYFTQTHVCLSDGTLLCSKHPRAYLNMSDMDQSKPHGIPPLSNALDDAHTSFQLMKALLRPPFLLPSATATVDVFPCFKSNMSYSLCSLFYAEAKWSYFCVSIAPITNHFGDMAP
ncbi:hypothetical protein TrVFT333_011777 [Trichoderma virens FT-333]|nr:hypothetical protein TrVFT333_011777 [Trichoderma virens FT-333]